MDPSPYCCRIRHLCCGQTNCARQHCITCSRQLPCSKIRSGNRRCAACTKARPGRLYNAGWQPSTKKNHAASLSGTSRLPTFTPAPPATSWWTAKPQAGFTAEAEVQSRQIKGKQRFPGRLYTQGWQTP